MNFNEGPLIEKDLKSQHLMNLVNKIYDTVHIEVSVKYFQRSLFSISFTIMHYYAGIVRKNLLTSVGTCMYMFTEKNFSVLWSSNLLSTPSLSSMIFPASPIILITITVFYTD